MKWDYEGQGLTWLFRALWVFAVIGGFSVMFWVGWALGALWKVFV